ncbi:type II secretion system F family protein [Patescibacteria group bacterium]|nr:type II secretion system F family protein [Patescibacteria group bacterium]
MKSLFIMIWNFVRPHDQPRPAPGNTPPPGPPPTVTSAPSSILFVRFTTKDRVLFAQRLSFLLRANVSLVESLTLIHNQTKSQRRQHLYATVISDIQAGHTLSNSLRKYQSLFGEFTINIINVGEQVGALSENLAYLADALAKKHALGRKVRSALIYPLFISVTTLGVTGFLVMYLFPKIMPIFVSLSIDLPPTTRALLALSEFLRAHGGATVVLGLCICVTFLVLRTKITSLRFATDHLILTTPVAGPIVRLYNCANFCRTLALCLHSGISLSEALTITAQTTPNLVFKRAYGAFAESVARGEKISRAMSSYTSLFPELLPQLLLIGETTGTLSKTLTYVTELYDTEVDEVTKNLSSTIEPVLLLTMGVFIGLIAVSVIAPIYEVTQHLNHSY